MHFDPDRELVLACDASPQGVGAVLSHRYPDGSDKPIAFASRTLNKTEKGFAQIDREALAVIFGIKRFHHFLCGRRFLIFTDHKPLVTLLRETKGVPTMCSGRIQRWALLLSAYQYKLEYRPGIENANADALSRLPTSGSSSTADEHPPASVLSLHILEVSATAPVSAAQLRKWTERDTVLARVRNYTLSGWPRGVPDGELRSYWNRRHELSVLGGCVLWGSRVVIPQQARTHVLEELHLAHPGETRMKALARSYVWWPCMDREIERLVKRWANCQAHARSPAEAPLHPWTYPDRPWTRIHMDFAGPFLGKYFMVVIDSYSKWMEVEVLSSTTTRVTVKTLQRIFATHGLPEVCVSDNGSNFTSAEFKDFMKGNCILHVKTAPYHPASNGLAERAVATFKGAMKKMANKYGPLESKVDRFLMRYRITPHSTTGEAPALLLMGRLQRSRLDLLRPELSVQLRRKQEMHKKHHDKTSQVRTFGIGQPVYVRNFNGKDRWLAGIIEQQKGPVSFVVRLPDGRWLRRHQDHLRARVPPERSEDSGLAQTPAVATETNREFEREDIANAPLSPAQHLREEENATEVATDTETVAAEGQPHTRQDDTEGQTVRRSSRQRKAPDQLNL